MIVHKGRSVAVGKVTKASVNLGDCFSDFVTWLVVSLFIIGSIVGIAFSYADKNQKLDQLKSKRIELKKDNADLQKELQCSRTELERQKNSKTIIVLAEKMGLRPARGQQIEHIRIAQKQETRNQNSFYAMD